MLSNGIDHGEWAIFHRSIAEKAIRSRAISVWKLPDRFEWTDGCSKRFAIHCLDFDAQKGDAGAQRRLVQGGDQAQPGHVTR
jgi:hypothetical protein